MLTATTRTNSATNGLNLGTRTLALQGGTLGVNGTLRIRHTHPHVCMDMMWIGDDMSISIKSKSPSPSVKPWPSVSVPDPAAVRAGFAAFAPFAVQRQTQAEQARAATPPRAAYGLGG